MRCGSCGAEGKGKFCRLCGAPLQQVQEQELPSEPGQVAQDEPMQQTEQSVEAAQTEQDTRPAEEVRTKQDAPPAEEVQTKQDVPPAETAQVDQSTNHRSSPLRTMLISSVVAGIIAAIAIVGLAFGLDWAAKQGEFQEDTVYHLLSHVIHIPPEQAAYFIHSLKPGAWLQLVLMHGVEIEGQYGVSTSDHMVEPLMFSFHMTLLLSAACAFSLIAVAGRILYSIVSKSLPQQLWKLMWVIISSLCYALTISMTIWLLAPKIDFLFGNSVYTLELDVQLWKLFLLTLLFSIVASLIGVGRWSFPKKIDLSNWLSSLVRFAQTLLLFFIIIIVLMIMSWSTTKPSQLHSTHITTMGSIWDAYKQDASMYGVIPNVLVQQFMYGLGATWHVDGEAAADLLSMDRPTRLHIVTGASEAADQVNQTDRASLKPLEHDLQLHWFHAALLLAYLYSLSRIQIKKLWSYLSTVLIIIVGVAALSAYANVTVAAGNIDQAFIGFRFTQSLLSIGIITAVFLIASYSLQRWFAKRRDLS